MIVYMLEVSAQPIDSTLMDLLKDTYAEVHRLELPSSHTELLPLFRDKLPGIVFIPANWEDLAAVKMVQEIRMLNELFPVILCGAPPSVAVACTAYNEGVSAILTLPCTLEHCQTVWNRTVENFRIQEKQHEEHNLANLASGADDSITEAVTRQIMARAMLDLYEGKGPILSEQTTLLMVSSSTLRQKHVADYLQCIGMTVETTDSITHAISLIENNAFSAIISDWVLADGDANDLANQLRKKLTRSLPRMIVWTANPKIVSRLKQPDNGIDEVILKPSKDAGLEDLLIAAVVAVYQRQGL